MIMARETKTQRAARVGALLAMYDAKNRELRKLAKDVESLKAEISAEAPDTYGDWVLATGTPREILDQQEAKRLLTTAGIVVPTKVTEAPIVVRPK